jgi:FtsP/CotA-like multicopper oxidase with cupredoxin domain
MGAGHFDRQPSSRMLVGKTTVFTLNTASQATSAFGTQTYQIRVATAAQPAFIQVGDGTATATSTGSMVLGTNVVDYLTVSPGQTCAVLQGPGGTAGTISVSEMT